MTDGMFTNGMYRNVRDLILAEGCSLRGSQMVDWSDEKSDMPIVMPIPETT